MSKVEDILASTKVGDVLDAAKLNKFLKRQEEEIEELKFFNIDEVELDNISPPIRPVVKRFIEQNS